MKTSFNCKGKDPGRNVGHRTEDILRKGFLRQKPNKVIHLVAYSHRQSGTPVASHYNFGAWNRLIKKTKQKMKSEVREKCY